MKKPSTFAAIVLIGTALQCKAFDMQPLPPPVYYDPSGQILRNNIALWNSIHLNLARESSLLATQTTTGKSTGIQNGSAMWPAAREHTVLSRWGVSSAAHKLAAAYPEDSRPGVERTFQELLDSYAEIEQRFGITRHDFAGAAASFLAASYMVYHGVDFPDEKFKPLVAQMQQVIGSTPEFAKASDAEKQEAYEQMAILGMFMAATQMALQQQPNPQIAANLKQAGKGYLEQFLKTDADRVRITDKGLVIQ